MEKDEEQKESSADNEEGQENGVFEGDCDDMKNGDEDPEDDSGSESGDSDEEEGEEGEEGSGFSSDESDGGSEKCAICLQKFLGQEIGSPETCEHHFCLKCITEWSKKVATCPVDRKIFPAILVKKEIFGIVQRIVDVEVGNMGEPTSLDEYDTDPTYCEICGHCDREDRLLLCDGCDLGYHLECLEPPMEYVPIEDWFCPTCQTDRNAEAHAEEEVDQPARRRVRLPRTGQSRRILQSIRQSARREVSTGRTDSLPSTPKKRSVVRKTKGRKTRARTKGTGRKKRRGRRRQKRRVVIERRPPTARGRLAVQLGILPPRPGQVYVGLPRCRAPVQSSQSSNASILKNLRYQAGITPLRIYSTSEDLADCIESFSDEEGPVGVARVQPVHRIGIPIKPSYPFPGSTRYVDIPQASSSPDILGPILNNQIIMLTDRNIQIKRGDGTLIPSLPVPSPSTSSSPSKSPRKNSVTNENVKNGFEPVAKSLKAKLDYFVNTPHNSRTPLSGSGVATRQAPSSPNSSDSNNTSGNNVNTSNNNSGSHSGSNTGLNSIASNQDSVISSRNARGGTYPNSQSNNDPNGARAYESFLHLSSNNNSPKQTPDRKKSVEKESENKVAADDDEEYNIYSDIEEDDNSKPPDNETEQDQPVPVAKDKDHDSDSDMVIDEDRVGLIKGRDSRGSHEGRGEQLFGNIPALEALNIPSPTSIPLPDSPPPASSLLDDDEDGEANYNGSERSGFPNRHRVVHPKAREEYDPSQPLNSSEEEEEEEEELDIQLPVPPVVDKIPPSQPLVLQSGNSSQLSQPRPDTAEVDLDLSTIPMPSDDYKRPTIQFSIPSRHKLIPISSLMKRQKGVARKENKNALSFTSEISKAFGEDKQDDSDEDSKGADNEPRMSLVAEIFGSDDEEEPQLPLIETGPAASIPKPNPEILETGAGVPVEDPAPASLELEDEIAGTAPSVNPLENTSRWKKIVVDEPTVDEEKSDNTQTNPTTNSVSQIEHVDENSNDSISVLEMIEKPKRIQEDNDDIQVVSVTTGDRRSKELFIRKPRQSDKEKPIVLESISEGDSEFDSSKGDSVGSGMKRKAKRDKEKERGREGERKGGKRKRSFSSVSVSNREEGEIVDSPGKRRKKKKEKKKSKKRKYEDDKGRHEEEGKGRKNKDDKNQRIDFSEKKVSDVTAPLHNSSEEENMGDNLIEWRKPSNSAKERNYRDGKPKPEERYFRPRDKKRDNSPRDRRDKHLREKSPQVSKDKSVKERNDSRRSRRRSASRSRSRSFSRTRNNRRLRSRSNRSSLSTRSFHSRSRSRSLRRSHKRGRFSLSPRRSRSRSRASLRLRSQSPARRRSRNRKRSLSNSRNRRLKGRKRSQSSSSSISKRGKRKRIKKKKEKEVEKFPEPREVEKEKERVEKEKERVDKDKEKKKKKKRREKSVSPAKEIFADGDSIVVSLNFQKPGNTTAFGAVGAKEGGGTPSRNNAESNEKRKGGRRGSRRGRSGEREENGKPRLLKKTLLIDLETSPIQEQNIGVSPTLIVLSDDEEGEDAHGKGKDKGLNDNQDGTAVTTSSSDGKNDGNSPYRHGVAADSTQIHHPNQSDSKLDDSSFSVSMCASVSPYEGSNLSPTTRGDSLVTSTRDSEMGLAHDDDSRSPSLSPSLKPSDNKMHQPHSPAGSPPPLPPGSPPGHHMHHDSRNENIATPTSSVSSHLSNHQSSMTPSAPGKPLIGNIPGLFPSSSVSASSNASVPPPVVIPTPPNPQLRFPSSVNQNLLTPNVLASVATALYAPLLAVRQQQQQSSSSTMTGKFSAPPGSGVNVIGNKMSGQQGSSVLLPKNQNSHGGSAHGSGGFRSKTNSSGLSTGEGDSPFSPNSSEGDDLFEPPLERGQMDSKSEKLSGNQSSNSLHGTGAGGNMGSTGGKPREKSSLFDSLFGGTPTKKSSMHHKSHDSRPSKAKGSHHHKSKSKRAAKGQKEIPKLSEGELRLTEDVPTSAVELRVKEKFLKKLNRQERVVEEVKLSLKPHYSKKHVTKDEYKEILRRAVPKICHNKSGEINPFKIKELVEAYVKKFRHSRKKDVNSS